MSFTNHIGGYKIRNQSEPHFFTLTIVDWTPVFEKEVYKEIILETFRFHQPKGILIHAYVIMTNHIHIICQYPNIESGLSLFIRSIKSYLAKQCLEMLSKSDPNCYLKIFSEAANKNSRNKKYQFWIQNNHPVELNTRNFTVQKINYIHANPLKAGLCERIEDYKYSSATNYVNGTGVLDVDVLDLW